MATVEEILEKLKGKARKRLAQEEMMGQYRPKKNRKKNPTRKNRQNQTVEIIPIF